MTTTELILLELFGTAIPGYADLAPIYTYLTLGRGEPISTVSANVRRARHMTGQPVIQSNMSPEWETDIRSIPSYA